MTSSPMLYREVRGGMLPGDLIAFSGDEFISRVIRWFTGSPISHVGGVYHRWPLDDSLSHRVQLVESTSLYDVVGVQTTYLSDHVQRYDGRVYWMPLKPAARDQFDEDAYLAYCEDTIGTPYDYFGAAGSAIDWWDWLLPNKRSRESLFCSEWWALGLQIAGVIPWHVNPAEVTPKDCVQWDLFHHCTQIAGDPKSIEVSAEEIL